MEERRCNEAQERREEILVFLHKYIDVKMLMLINVQFAFVLPTIASTRVDCMHYYSISCTGQGALNERRVVKGRTSGGTV